MPTVSLKHTLLEDIQKFNGHSYDRASWLSDLSQIGVVVEGSDDTEIEINDFLEDFKKLSGSKLKMGLRDDFPRGTGRVMNFREDLTYAGFDSIWNLEPYVELDE